MKNIQVIDGAKNCHYPIYAISDELFELLFPNWRNGQNIQFLENVPDTEEIDRLDKTMWNHQVKKEEVQGIHRSLCNIKKVFTNQIKRII